MVRDHPFHAEARGCRGAARGAVERARRGECRRQPGGVVPEEPGDAVIDDLGGGAGTGGHDRGARGQSFDHHESERLGPLDGVDQGDGVPQESVLLGLRQLPHVLRVRAEERSHPLLEVRALLRLVHLRGEEQPHTCAPGGDDRLTGTLVRVHPAEEASVAAVTRAERDARDVEAVVDDAVDAGSVRRRRLMVGYGDEPDVLIQLPVQLASRPGTSHGSWSRPVRRADGDSTTDQPACGRARRRRRPSRRRRAGHDPSPARIPSIGPRGVDDLAVPGTRGTGHVLSSGPREGRRARRP